MSENAPFSVETQDEIQTMNRSIFDTIKPYVKGRCLELQSGKNSFCQLFVDHNWPIHLSDSNPQHVQRLREIYKENKLVRQVHEFDLKNNNFPKSHPNTLEVFDTMIALQLLKSEFIQVVDNIKYVLPHSGTLTVIAPVYTAVYEGLDQNARDWKRYNSESFKYLTTYDFSILKIRYFNLPYEIANNHYPNTGLSAVIIAKRN